MIRPVLALLAIVSLGPAADQAVQPWRDSFDNPKLLGWALRQPPGAIIAVDGRRFPGRNAAIVSVPAAVAGATPSPATALVRQTAAQQRGRVSVRFYDPGSDDLPVDAGLRLTRSRFGGLGPDDAGVQDDETWAGSAADPRVLEIGVVAGDAGSYHLRLQGAECVLPDAMKAASARTPGWHEFAATLLADRCALEIDGVVLTVGPPLNRVDHLVLEVSCSTTRAVWAAFAEALIDGSVTEVPKGDPAAAPIGLEAPPGLEPSGQKAYETLRTAKIYGDYIGITGQRTAEGQAFAALAQAPLALRVQAYARLVQAATPAGKAWGMQGLVSADRDAFERVAARLVDSDETCVDFHGCVEYENQPLRSIIGELREHH